VKEYSARLAKSQAQAIQDFYVAPRLQADRRALPLHLQLHRAHVLMLGERDIVDLLIDAKADLNHEDYTGKSALGYAIDNRKMSVANDLKKAGATE